MLSIYEKPLRVYLILGALAIWGVLSGLGLSVSLFPMSSQSVISVNLGYGSYSSTQFFESVGRNLETGLQSLKAGNISVQKVEANYGDKNARLIVRFDWGADPDEALRAVENRVRSQLSPYEEAIRNSAVVHSWSDNQGFFAVSFYSPMRSLDDLYQVLDPILKPIQSKVQDASELDLFNPNRKEITVRLNPEKLALFEVSTMDVERAIKDAIFSLNGGTLQLGETKYQISLPKQADSILQLENIRVSTSGRNPILLKDVASLQVALSEDSRQRYRTSGVESLILFANPKEGGNIKRMSDEIMAALAVAQPQWPRDVQFQVLVNPSDFINRSVMSVLKEVGLAALLAVLVLFAFIGSFRNVITAAVEIPLSLALAFILMKLAGMNLNLISLGGLALSAGMNVDASVVVLENIFRHFEGKPRGMTYEEKARTVAEAVNEVKMPILASTAASLVVFLPLVFTQGLTNSLLGDLAKAVIFSHGLSAIVALVLVPTIRLHLLRKGEMGHVKSPFEKSLKKLDGFYRRTLGGLLRSNRAQAICALGVALALPALIFIVAPRLPREVIGKPESDWMIVGLSSPLINTTQQMEAEIEVLEQDLAKRFPDILYTFSQMGPWGGQVMMRLKDEKKMAEVQSAAEDAYKNTATKNYYVMPWSPSELSIPDPPQFRLEISGGTAGRRLDVARDLQQQINDSEAFDNVSVRPAAVSQKGIVVTPLPNLSAQAQVLGRYELSHYLRVATDGAYVDQIYDRSAELPIYLRMPKDRAASLENLAALPVGFEGRLIPLGALAKISMRDREPQVYRENQQVMAVLSGTLKKNRLGEEKPSQDKARAVVDAYREKMKGVDAQTKKDNPILVEAVADQELRDALAQLRTAILISVALIFLTMVLQLGDIAHSLLVLVAIPLGIIGVITSLAIFRSTVSLNSGLGTILLNGIAVANSIILVDFIRKKFQDGMSAYDATLEASTARMRPILMTSLTTVLGMLPIALGWGEGGKTLQPLGITVCGGLWVSALLTLYFVPCLQYRYLNWKSRRPAS